MTKPAAKPRASAARPTPRASTRAARTKDASSPEAPRKPRIRRTAEDARTSILDATERRLVTAGPAGIRVQDVAADVGVSHPTVLHHFGSRERLVDAVIARRVQSMMHEVVLSVVGAGGGALPTGPLFERSHERVGPGGHARVLAVLSLEGRHTEGVPGGIRPLAETVHAARLARRPAGAPKPSAEDTLFTVLLAALALFGEAIVGPTFRGELPGETDPAVSKRFRAWLAELIAAHLDGDPSTKPKRKRA